MFDKSTFSSMIPATAVPHSVNTLDRIAFCKSVREKRKQLQLNHHTNVKETVSSSTENAFLTQMLQSPSSSSTSSSSISSALNIPSFLRKGDFSSSPPSHRTVTSTLTNILPALLNGTLQSPRAISPSGQLSNVPSLSSPTSTTTTDTLVDMKCSASLPVSPAATHLYQNQSASLNNSLTVPLASSPPRCRSYPMAALTKRASPPVPNGSHQPSAIATHPLVSPTSYLLAMASSCPALITTSNTATTTAFISSTSPSPDDTTPKIVRSASVKSCASDSGVSSSSPLSDNNIVHVFRTNYVEPTQQPQAPTTASRKRKSLAHFYDELNKDKKLSTEATVSSGFLMPPTSTTNNSSNNIPYSQQEALAIGYAQYALMHTLTQQFRVNYPAAFLHAAAASGYLPLPTPMMAAVAAAASATTNGNGTKSSATADKCRERRKQQQQQQQQPESDNNNNHIRATTPANDQPYRRETYQTLLESSRLLGQHHHQQKLLKPVPIDLRKHGGRTMDNSPIPSNSRYASSSSSTSPIGSPPCLSPPKSHPIEPGNDYVCIPKKLMPVIGARINDWLERNVNFALSLSVINDTFDNNHSDKLLLLTRIWHRLLLASMIENGFEIYVTKDLQMTNMNNNGINDLSSTSNTHPTENDVKQIESLIARGKALEIDEIGFNLIREVIVYKEGKTLFESISAGSFEKAECHAQTRLTAWCSSRVKYSKVVFLLCNIYQVKEDIFERLFCAGSMHQSIPIHAHIERFLASATPMDA